MSKLNFHEELTDNLFAAGFNANFDVSEEVLCIIFRPKIVVITYMIGNF